MIDTYRKFLFGKYNNYYGSRSSHTGVEIENERKNGGKEVAQHQTYTTKQVRVLFFHDISCEILGLGINTPYPHFTLIIFD